MRGQHDCAFVPPFGDFRLLRFHHSSTAKDAAADNEPDDRVSEEMSVHQLRP
jgi:hypothetical protein